MANNKKSGSKLRNSHGQSLVIAIIVMFLLVFIGVVFVLIVARNQGRASHSKDVLEAQYLAEAGINYADTMLRTGEKGADWRPVPTATGFTWNLAYNDPAGSHWEPDAANLPDYAKGHPDFRWLKPYASRSYTGADFGLTGEIASREVMGPDGGFTSYDMGKGRYLLRVSYNPEPGDPTSKYIKIECVGRIGIVDKDDPTTWVPQRLRRELTAYKPIGVTDYLRFEGNREHRRGEIALGAPDVPIKYGFYDSTSSDYRTAPIRVNGNLTWYGSSVELYLSRNEDASSFSTPESLVEVSGEISSKVTTSTGTPGSVTVMEILNGGAPGSIPVLPTSDAAYTTANGLYRDGEGNTDANSQARQIKRIEPPVIDSADTPTKVPRYVTLTRDSGKWLKRDDTDQNARSVSSGRYGWGAGVYIDNRDDLQPESETLFGGYTPRTDWMKPNNDVSAYWQGPYYVPPAVVITLNPYDTDGDRLADITITRTDVKSRGRDSQYGRKVYWYDAVGNPIVGFNPVRGIAGDGVGSTITIPYPQGTHTYYYWGPDANGNGTPDNDELKAVSFEQNGVIYAEGNVRIRGMLPGGKGYFSGQNDAYYDPVQLTVVSGGIIYIDGNVLKFRDPVSGQTDPRCAISLLAKEYVCVNTTQFMSLLTSTGPTTIGSDSRTGDPPYHLIITPEPTTVFSSVFSFGPLSYVPTASDPRFLFCRQAGQYGPSYINMWLNRTLMPLQPAGPLGDFVYGTGDPRFCAEGVGQASVFEHKVWDLNAMGGSSLTTAIGMPNYFDVGLDQSSMTRSNYLLSLFTVQPLDIRIEAAMFAQNRSFYLIPGNWFNMDRNDVAENPSNPRTTQRPRGVDEKWPFFGQALDVRITIDGAITENLPAPIQDVTEWYAKWSNIPPKYGSSDQNTLHYDVSRNYGEGLTFQYDPKLGWPVYTSGGVQSPIRTDDYGRPLPVTPCLPVCESLIYYGEPT